MVTSEQGITVVSPRSTGCPNTASTLAVFTNRLRICSIDESAIGTFAVSSVIMLLSPFSNNKSPFHLIICSISVGAQLIYTIINNTTICSAVYYHSLSNLPVSIGCSNLSKEKAPTTSGTSPLTTESAIVLPVIALSMMPTLPCPTASVTFFQPGASPNMG